MTDPLDPSSPHWDPNWHEPEIPVSGLGQWPDDYIVDHAGDPGYVPPEHVDAEAPVDPRQQYLNATGWIMYQFQLWANNALAYQFGGDDIPALRRLLKRYLAIELMGITPPVYVVRVLDTIRQKWVDLDGNPLADQVNGWIGMSEFRLMVGATVL